MAFPANLAFAHQLSTPKHEEVVIGLPFRVQQLRVLAPTFCEVSMDPDEKRGRTMPFADSSVHVTLGPRKSSALQGLRSPPPCTGATLLWRRWD